MPLSFPHLAGEKRSGAALLFAVSEQRRLAARGIGGNGTEQPPQFAGAVAIELAVGAARQLGDLREEPRRHTIVPFLEHEDRQAQQAELSRLVPDLVDVLLAAVADKDDGIDAALAPLFAGITQQPADLGLARQAADGTHQPCKLVAVGRPAADLEFLEAAIEGQPNLEAA